jgi:hypothetical protein
LAKVNIIRREVAEGLGAAGEPVKGLAVTYSTTQFPPRSLFLEGETVTDAQVADAIRKDIAGLSAQKITTMEI